MKHMNLKSHDQGKKSGEMACPNCGSSIKVTFQDLLVNGKLICIQNECATVLHLNKAQSQPAIAAMTKLQDEVGKLSNEV